MNENNHLIVYVSKLGTNVLNPIFCSCNSINIEERPPENLEIIPISKWITMRSQIKKIYKDTKNNMALLKITFIFFAILTYYHYLVFLVLVMNVYFIFYSRNISRKLFKELQESLNNTIFNLYDLHIFFKRDFSKMYLYIVKPRIVMTDVLQDGIIIDDEITITEQDNLPTATAIQV